MANEEETPYEALERHAEELLIKSAEQKDSGSNKGTAELNRQTCLLLQYVRDMQGQVPLPLLQLIAHRLDVPADPYVKNTIGPGIDADSVADWDRAVFFEARHPEDPNAKFPSTASENSVAKHVGRSTKTIRPWRADVRYREKVVLLRGVIGYVVS